MTKPTTKTPQKPRPLTIKQKIFVEEYIDTKGNGTAAALKAYDIQAPTKERRENVAAVIARENLRKPQIVSKLADYNELIENTLLGTVQDYSRSDNISERSLAVDTSKWLHDKIHGKATQKTSSVSVQFTQAIDNTNV